MHVYMTYAPPEQSEPAMTSTRPGAISSNKRNNNNNNNKSPLEWRENNRGKTTMARQSKGGQKELPKANDASPEVLSFFFLFCFAYIQQVRG